jgi:hypothetical protein
MGETLIYLMGVFFYLGKEAGVGSLGGDIASSPILALACAMGKLHLVLVADQKAPPPGWANAFFF